MTDQNLLSKSSPSQLQPFQLNRSRTQPLPTEAFFVSSQKSNALKPSNLSHVPCKFYKQGTCTAGANCTFSHSSDLSSESAVCKYFVKGNCKFGTKCALLHTMSPFGNSSSSSSNGGKNGRMMIIGTPPAIQQQPMFTGRRKTSDQMMMSYSSSSNNGLDHRSFLNDPFASSAPSMSLFGQYSGEQLWRNGATPRTNMISNDLIGVRSSPRESDHILGSSPFRTTYLSSSMRSGSNTGGFSRQASYVTPGTLSNNGFHDDYFVSKQQQQQQQQGGGEDYDDLNDAMLPSSLNDLFTPSELQVRRVRQQESSTLDNRVPFYNMKSAEYEENEGTAAINIPGVINGSGSSGTGSSDYLQQREDDDDVQFFMEDDEAVTYDHHMNTKYSEYPSLISLPST